MDFLAELFESGLSYSALNTARSALATVVILPDGQSIGSHPLIKRMLRGVFLERPALPKYKVTWDVTLVLNFLKRMAPSRGLSLLQHGQKLAMLLALLTGQRGQYLYLLDIRNIEFSNEQVKLRMGDLLKTSKPGNHLGEIVLQAFPQDQHLCVVTLLTNYLSRTHKLRGNETKLFIGGIAPHKGISRDSLARWLKTIMQQTGIDTQVFSPHSTRAASTSAGFQRVPLDTILRTAGWSSDCMFRKFYNKPIVSCSAILGDDILNVDN